MLARKPERMTIAEFLLWEERQEEKWELVDGVPVLRSERWWRDPVTGMAGARKGHNRIAGNVYHHLRRRLAGGLCEPFNADMKVVSPTGNARYPDVVVDCDRGDNADLEATDPRVIFEVLSPSNRPGKQSQLFNDYQAIDSIECLVLIEQDLVEAQVFVRGERFWPVRTLRDLSEVIPLPMLGTELPLMEIYEGMGFEAPP